MVPRIALSALQASVTSTPTATGFHLRAILRRVSDQPYRAPIPVQPDPYLAAWRKLKWRVRWSRAGMVIVFSAPMLRLFLPGISWLPLLAVQLCGSLFSAAFTRFTCPHCKEPMLRFWEARADDWKRCRHCGIAVGTPKALAEPVPSRVAPMLRVEDDAPAAREEDVEQEPGERPELARQTLRP
jgi:hypothetical protein